MAYQDCLAGIKAATGLADMTDAEAADMLDAVLKARDKIVADRSAPPGEAETAAAKAAADLAEIAAQRQRITAQRNVATRISRRQRIEENARAMRQEGGNARLGLAVENEMIGLNNPNARGRGLSAEGWGRTRAAQYTEAATRDLYRAGLYKAAGNRNFEREWGAELYELSREAAGEADARPGRTGNAQALEIAKIFRRYQALAKANLNKLGAWVGDYSGYITRTMHDSDLVRRDGFEEWRDFIRPRLDPTTFGDADPEKFLRDVWHNLVTGVHENVDGFYKDPAFVGPANLAKKLSQERVLHFKDAESWLDYQGKYSRGSLIEQMFRSFERAAHDEALMSRWGTNPRAEFGADMRYLQTRFHDTDPDAVRELNDRQNRLQNIFDHLDGTAYRPVSGLGARIGSLVRLDESLSKLGMVAFTHLSAGVTKAHVLRHEGLGFLEAYGNFWSSAASRLRAGDRGEFNDLVLAGLEGQHHDIVSRFSLDDALPGKASSLANTFFKWSGLTALLNRQKAGAEWALSRHLGGLVDRRFEDLPEETKRSLSAFDISPDDWHTLRLAPKHPEIDGRKFLTPDAATRSTKRLSDAQRDALGLKLHAYLRDTADRAVVTPGIYEHVAFTQGNRPGTVLGEALRFVAQFKTWPLAAARQLVFRDIRENDTAGAVGSILTLAAGSALVGTMINAMKDKLKGRNPRPWNDPRTWIAGMMQGGGFGILGDYLFGEYSRFSQNALETFAGPTLGTTANQLINLWTDAKALVIRDDEHHRDPEYQWRALAADAFRAVMDHVPFANLFFARAALDYLFTWRIQEWMNPGYQRRFEQRIKRQYGQSFWLSPAQAVR